MIAPTQPAAPRTLRSFALLMLRWLLRLLRTIRVLCCMCRLCHVLLCTMNASLPAADTRALPTLPAFSAAERIGAVEQNATHRIEVIRTEMSRALHDHKERTDRLIDQLTARVAHLEAGRAYTTASDRSTPPRHDRAQFFDTSDHDSDDPPPADLPPVPGSLLNRGISATKSSSADCA